MMYLQIIFHCIEELKKQTPMVLDKALLPGTSDGYKTFYIYIAKKKQARRSMRKTGVKRNYDRKCLS